MKQHEKKQFDEDLVKYKIQELKDLRVIPKDWPVEIWDLGSERLQGLGIVGGLNYEAQMY